MTVFKYIKINTYVSGNLGTLKSATTLNYRINKATAYQVFMGFALIFIVNLIYLFIYEFF